MNLYVFLKKIRKMKIRLICLRWEWRIPGGKILNNKSQITNLSYIWWINFKIQISMTTTLF